VAFVAGAHIGGVILEDHITDFEELDAVFLGHALVVVQALQNPRHQGGAHHFIGLVGRVKELHRRVVVWAPQVGEVLASHAQTVGEHLNVAGAGNLLW